MSNKKGYRVPPDVKADTVRRVKEEGVSVTQAAKDHGIHETTIYGAGFGCHERSLVGGIHSHPEAEPGTLRPRRRAHRAALRDPKKELSKARNRSAMARAMGVSRAVLYYVPRQDRKNWSLKVRMEEELQRHPSYGCTARPKGRPGALGHFRQPSYFASLSNR
jgi:transposase-like protein